MTIRILLIRTSALGDIVHCLPVLTALRRHFPNARIGWLVEKSFAPLLEDHPDLDELLIVELQRWRTGPLAPATLRGLASFLQALHRFSPDVVLDLMGNHKAGVLAALSLCERRIGLSRPFRREPSSAVWLSERVAPQGAHQVDQALSVLAALGLPQETADFGPEKLVASPPEEVLEPIRGLERPFAVIHPGAAWGNKRYPPAWWGEVARQFHLATTWPVLAATGPGEQELGQQVAAASRGGARPVEAPTLPILVELLRQAGLVLAGDTGPLHLAHALGTPVLCLMGPTDPWKHGPYNAPELALWKRLPCSFCHKRFSETKACLLELAPASVAQRAAELVVPAAAPV